MLGEKIDPRAEALGEFWDGLTFGRGPRDEKLIEESLAETITRVYELDETPPPDPVFINQLESHLALQRAHQRPRAGMGAIGSQLERWKTTFRDSADAAVGITRRVGQRDDEWRLRPKWAYATAVVALLLAVVVTAALITAYFTDRDRQNATMIPAVVPNDLSGLVVGGSSTYLTSATVDPGEIGVTNQATWNTVSFQSHRMQPGDTLTPSLTSDDYFSGLAISTITKGEVLIVSDGWISVDPTGGALIGRDRIDAGTPVQVEAGHSVFFEPGSSWTLANETDAPVEWLDALVYHIENSAEVGDSGTGDSTRIRHLTTAHGAATTGLSSGDLTFSLVATRVEPGGQIILPGSDSVRFVLVDQGMVHLAIGEPDSDGSYRYMTDARAGLSFDDAVDLDRTLLNTTRESATLHVLEVRSSGTEAVAASHDEGVSAGFAIQPPDLPKVDEMSKVLSAPVDPETIPLGLQGEWDTVTLQVESLEAGMQLQRLDGCDDCEAALSSITLLQGELQFESESLSRIARDGTDQTFSETVEAGKVGQLQAGDTVLVDANSRLAVESDPGQAAIWLHVTLYTYSSPLCYTVEVPFPNGYTRLAVFDACSTTGETLAFSGSAFWIDLQEITLEVDEVLKIPKDEDVLQVLLFNGGWLRLGIGEPGADGTYENTTLLSAGVELNNLYGDDLVYINPGPDSVDLHLVQLVPLD